MLARKDDANHDFGTPFVMMPFCYFLVGLPAALAFCCLCDAIVHGTAFQFLVGH
jgi:hypothetical protein